MIVSAGLAGGSTGGKAGGGVRPVGARGVWPAGDCASVSNAVAPSNRTAIGSVRARVFLNILRSRLVVISSDADRMRTNHPGCSRPLHELTDAIAS